MAVFLKQVQQSSSAKVVTDQYLCVECVERDLKAGGSLRYTGDDLLHVAMIATNVNRYGI